MNEMPKVGELFVVDTRGRQVWANDGTKNYAQIPDGSVFAVVRVDSGQHSAGWDVSIVSCIGLSHHFMSLNPSFRWWKKL